MVTFVCLFYLEWVAIIGKSCLDCTLPAISMHPRLSLKQNALFTLLDPTWCDGWLLSDTEVHLNIHDASGFPINLFKGDCSPDSETGKYVIKVIAMDMDKVKCKV